MSIGAAAIADAGLRALTDDCWQLPAPLGRRLRHAVRTASCERAQTLRCQLALVGLTNLDQVFAHTLTPRYVMDMLADLGAIGALSRGDIHMIEEAVLATVGRDGAWLTYGDYQERTSS